VLILPQRQTALVAQQAADVDLLSQERFRLGVGLGWNWVEYDALGQNFRTRGRRMDEQIGLLRQLWSTPLVSFEGEFDRIDRAGINPRPKRQIPIWLGGHTQPAFARAARLADGFIFGGTGDPVLTQIRALRDEQNRVKRDVNGFGLELVGHGTELQDGADMFKRWRDAGGTHACIPSIGRGFGADIGAHIGFYAELRRRVGLN
jgi:probable F420-dependent oxidoreductase